ETYSTDIQASTPLGGGHVLTYGVHAHRDDGRAPDDEQFYYNRPHPSVSDSPDSRWANYGLYLQDEWEAVADLLYFTAAVRYDYMVFHSLSTSAYSPPAGDPADDFYRDTNDALTGGLGATVHVEEHWRAVASWSRGYRQYAPNFGIRQLGAGVLIPNEFLDPVTADNYEAGVRTRYTTFSAENFFWYSKIKDWQEVGASTFNGSDWYDFNSNGSQDANENIVAYQSISSAYLYGLEGKATLYLSTLSPDLPDGWSVWGGYAWNAGKDKNHDYMRHTMPLRGLLGIRWDDSDPERAAYVEGIVEMVNRYDRVAESRLSDLGWRRDPQDKNSPLLRSYGGVPGYTILSIYAGINLCPNARLRVGVENLTDKKYRRAHSRMDAPGIGFIAGLDVSF
ncbi:MAG: TonB-dependent receptor, partial [Planctomycetes bacterium]|nr:TonB-dependent receptor [Planctomycetota bacterium]